MRHHATPIFSERGSVYVTSEPEAALGTSADLEMTGMAHSFAVVGIESQMRGQIPRSNMVDLGGFDGTSG